MEPKNPGMKPDNSNNGINPSFSWEFFDSQLAKYRGKKVSQVGKWLLSVPKFVINWFKVYEPRWRTTLALLVLVAVLSSAFFVNSSLSHAASYSFVQTDWSGGISATTAAHPGDQSSWNKYTAQSTGTTFAVGNRANSGLITVSPSTTSLTVTEVSPLFVDIMWEGTTTITSVTWNTSETLTNLGTIASGGGAAVRKATYGIKNPSIGTHNVTVTFSAPPGAGAFISMISTTGGDITTGWRTIYTRTDVDGTGPGRTVTDSQNGDIVIHAAVVYDNTITWGAGETSTNTTGNSAFGTNMSGGMSTKPATGSNTTVDATDATFYAEITFAVIPSTIIGVDTSISGTVRETTSAASSFSETFTTTTNRDGANTSSSGAGTIAFRSKSFFISNSCLDPAGTAPAGTVQNDVMVALFIADGRGTNSITLPTGWTSLYNGSSGSTASDVTWRVGYIVRGASAPSMAFTVNNQGGSLVCELHILTFSGVDNSSPIDSQSSNGSSYTSTATPNPPSTTAVAAATMAVAGAVHWRGSAVSPFWGAPSGYTLRSDNTSGNDGMMITKSLSSAGAEDPGQMLEGNDTTTSGSDHAWNGFTITLNTAAANSTWTTSGQLAAPSGVSPANAQSLTMDNVSLNISKATLTKNDTVGTGTITYYLSNDGSTFSQVTPGSQFTFSTAGSDLRFKVILTGNATVQDLSISILSYFAAVDLTSSAYNTGDANNLVTKLAWNATVPSGQTIKFQIRSAPNSSGSPGTWSSWCGYADCSGSTYFTTGDNNVTLSGSHPLRAGGNDQWFQYKIFFTSNGGDTVVVQDLTVTYVVNAPPNFDTDYPTTAAGGASAAQVTNSASADFGKVTINYRIRDTDTSSGTINPGFVTPSLQYNIGAGWISITSGFLAATDLNNKAVDVSNYTTYSATWNASSQIGTNTYLTTAQVRVNLNDNEAANNTATATTADFTLDTKVPVISAFTVNSTTDIITLTAADDTNLQYRLSNNSDLSADGVNGTSGAWQSAGGNSISVTPSWTFAGAPGAESVYVQVRDTSGNVSSATAVAPATPVDMDIKDISNADAASFKLFISWSVYTPVAGAAFTRYEVYRSTNGSSYSSLGNITDINVNYYADFATAQGTTYYYKVRVVDTTTDIGNFSAVVSDTPNGTQPGDVAPPIISAVTVGSVGATSATITWTTDELSDSRIDYSVSPATTFDVGQARSSVVTSHSITLTGLIPNTHYLFAVRSADVFGNRTTDNNSSAGYSFTTGTGPIISGVTETSVDENSATIFWTTDTNSDSFVSYSTSPILANPIKVGSAALVGGSAPYQHSVNISNLVSGSTYYYKVESKDAAANNTEDTNGGTYYSFVTTTDNVDPVITNISTPVIAATAAVVVWQTDELATTQLSWGATSGNLTTTTSPDLTLTIFHVVSISGLAENTKYFFEVMSKDSANNESVSAEESFTTGATTIITQIVSAGGGGGGSSVILDTTAPVISSLQTQSVTSFNAKVNFTTSEDAFGIVQYGTSPTTLNLSTSTLDYGKDQGLSLTGLKMGTDYYYKAKAIDKSGNVATSPDPIKFTTKFFTESTINIGDAEAFQSEVENAIEAALPSLVPPFISNPQVSDITDSSATIKWRTNLKTYSIVAFAQDQEYDAAKQNPYVVEISNTTDKVTDHELILPSLNPNTRYHFQVRSFSIPRLVGQSNDLTFVTKALNIQAQINAISNSSFHVAWRTTDPTSSVVEFRNTRTGVLNQKAIDEQATSHEILVDGLTPATTYEVSVFGVNAKGNRVQTATAVKITTSQDTAAPEIVSLKIDTAIVPGRTDRAQTIVSWKTNEPSTSTVYYEEGAGTSIDQHALSNKVEITNSFVLDHAVVLTVLKPGGLYRVQVASTDTAGNITTLPIKTIVVPRQSESILDVVFKNFEDTFKFLRQIGK